MNTEMTEAQQLGFITDCRTLATNLGILDFNGMSGVIAYIDRYVAIVVDTNSWLMEVTHLPGPLERRICTVDEDGRISEFNYEAVHVGIWIAGLAGRLEQWKARHLTRRTVQLQA